MAATAGGPADHLPRGTRRPSRRTPAVRTRLRDKALGDLDAGLGRALVGLDQELDVAARQPAAVLVEPQVEPVEHVLAGSCERAGEAVDETDREGAGGALRGGMPRGRR